MRDRKELEKFIGEKLSEIREAYVDYISQFADFKIPESWESGDHHLSLSVFSDNYSAFSCISNCEIDGDEKIVYTVDFTEKHGSFNDKYSTLHTYMDRLNEFDAIKKVGKTE
jgi:hypothetical protein